MKKLIIVMAFLLIAPQTVFAHALLMETAPEDKAVLDESPGVISVSFMGYIEHFFSKIEVFNSAGERVSDKTKFRDGDEGTVMEAELSKKLGPGEFTVKWKCLGKDGHKQKGSYSFRIK
jgi:methionine-rich copper-binding protein CopC